MDYKQVWTFLSTLYWFGALPLSCVLNLPSQFQNCLPTPLQWLKPFPWPQNTGPMAQNPTHSVEHRGMGSEANRIKFLTCLLGESDGFLGEVPWMPTSWHQMGTPLHLQPILLSGAGQDKHYLDIVAASGGQPRSLSPQTTHWPLRAMRSTQGSCRSQLTSVQTLPPPPWNIRHEHNLPWSRS